MATSTTFKGAPKPYGATGHFDESRRHSLQAKGIKTGHLSDQAVYEQYGITNLEKNAKAPDVPMTSEGIEDVQAEAIKEKRLQPKKESLSEKFKKIKSEYEEGFKKQKELQTEKRKEKLYKELDRKIPNSEPTPESKIDHEEIKTSDDDEDDNDSLPKKMGELIANVNEDYTPKDLVNITDPELEMLAVRFKTQNKDSMALFGDPTNPFLDELKKRIEARDEIHKEKLKLRAELKHPKKEEGLFDDMF